MKLLSTDEGVEQFILCRSPDRAAKEAAMLQRQLDRLQNQLGKTHEGLQRKAERDLEKVGRRGCKHPGSSTLELVDFRPHREGLDLNGPQLHRVVQRLAGHDAGQGGGCPVLGEA
ncbi:MAG: hypothetical protein H7A46_18870 [Verrucomicrobiales bacterium]|nr:hypothetical protein [Verrucomicrobiales bacterium]